MSYTVRATDLGKIRWSDPELVSSVLQNIAVILSTPKGSVPLYRDFGLSTVFLDKPMPMAKMMMIAEIREAIEKWEPRARYTGISFSEDVSGALWPAVEVEIIGDE